MSTRYTNDAGKECYKEVEPGTLFDSLEFHVVLPRFEDDVQYALHTNLGSLTVLDRRTGFGWRDVETGFRDMDGKFWLASGRNDVRDSGVTTIGQAIDWVKSNSNTCKGE